MEARNKMIKKATKTRLVKGSKEAKEWAQKMKDARNLKKR